MNDGTAEVTKTDCETGDIVNDCPAKMAEKSAEKIGTFSKKRVDAALKQMQTPLSSIAGGIRGAISAVMFDLPKNIAQKSLSTLTKVTTGAVALPANVAKGTINLAMAPLGAALGLISVIPEKTLGKISELAERTRTRALNAIGVSPEAPSMGEPEALPKAA